MLVGGLRLHFASKFFISTSLLLSAQFSNVCQTVKSSHSSLSRMQRIKDIVKPAEDTRLYRGLKLENGLQVLLVSDPETDNSAASLSVHVGSFLDPWDVQGLAHFLEHMLFMGTKKYPSENEYSKFLSQNAGNSNAYTTDVCTNYYFDIACEQLDPALDRFSQFFIEPLMLADSVNREMEAVNSEYQKNKENDGWRELQIAKILSNRKHDFYKFSIGNLETLRDIPTRKKYDIRVELKKFYERFYSANIMSLVVLGKESLDELEAIVVPKFFPILNRKLQPRLWPSPYGAAECMKQVLVVPIRDKRTMNLTFVYPDDTKHYKSAPGHYISHLIGYEGKGSLLSELKELGYVSSLASWVETTDGFGSFTISVDLTEEGLEKTDDIAKNVFQYIDMLHQVGPQEYIFQELKDLNFIKFNFMEKSNPVDTVQKYSAKMHYYPLEEIISANILLTEFRPDLIREMMAFLTPENCSIMITSKKFEEITDKKEHHFGVRYKVDPFSAALLEKIRNCGTNPKYQLPVKNVLIPTNFDLYCKTKEAEQNNVPERIINKPQLKVWFLQDKTYLKPKVFYGVRLINPINHESAEMNNAHYLFSMLFPDHLTEFLYDAKIAGLLFEFSASDMGFSMQFFGYNHKMSAFLEQILDRLASYKISKQRFDIFKEKYVRWLKNYRAQALYKLVGYYNSLLMSERMFSYEDSMDCLDALTIEAVEGYWKRFVKNIEVEVLVYGNADNAQANIISKSIESRFLTKHNSQPLPADVSKGLREVVMPKSQSFVYEAINEVQTMKAVHVYYQVGNTLKDRYILYVIDQILQEPFFDYLRTKEQLGYIVYSKYRESSGVHGMVFVIQSQFGAEYLDNRIEAFIVWAEQQLMDMSQEEFEKEKQSLVTKLQKKKKRLYHFAQQVWGEIERKEYNFKRKEALIQGIQAVTKSDALALFKNSFDRNSPGRQKMSVRITKIDPKENRREPTEEAKIGAIPAVEVAAPKLIRDHKKFKEGLAVFPRPAPMIE